MAQIGDYQGTIQDPALRVEHSSREPVPLDRPATARLNRDRHRNKDPGSWAVRMGRESQGNWDPADLEDPKGYRASIPMYLQEFYRPPLPFQPRRRFQQL
jgi:hypothetical protein